MILSEPVALDRRRKRSNDPLVALHYQLAQTRKDGRFDAVVVADDAGVVVAGAGAWATCEELAAYAPLIAQGGLPEAALRGSRVAEMGSMMEVVAVEVGGQTVLLCARGVRGPKAMQNAAQGVARILAKAA